MASLEEITPEQNLIHKNKVLGFIKKLMENYSNLKVIHKPFTQIEQNLTKNLFAKDNRFIISSEPALNLMPEVDIVLFDSISTGLGEAIQIGVPAIVYNNHFDYDLASNEGKKINDEFEKNHILFYDDRSGIESVEKIINNFPNFHRNTVETINKFKELVGM